jgi:hypothetical protein
MGDCFAAFAMTRCDGFRRTACAITRLFFAVTEGIRRIHMFIAQIRRDRHSTPSESHLFGHGSCYKHATRWVGYSSFSPLSEL